MTIQMKTVGMTDGSQRISLETPFHPALPARLRALGGKWHEPKRVWLLPTDIEQEVRQVCLDFFAVDPLAAVPPELITVRIDISAHSLHEETVYMFGRAVLRRAGRDNPVTPGTGVSIVAGGFARSGGSRNNPIIGSPDDGTTILIRDVPRAGLAQVTVDYPQAVVEIVEPARAPTLFADALLLADKLGQIMRSLSDDEKAEIVKKLMGD